MPDPTPLHWERPVAADAIEQELDRLWREVTHGGQRVTRALMSNLIVLADAPAAHNHRPPTLDEDLWATGRKHPSRVVVVLHAAGSTAPVEASISITAHGDSPTLFGVEQITVCSDVAGPALASIVRPLVLGDLPTSIWWASSDPFVRELGRSLASLARQLVYDSRQWGEPIEAFRAIQPIARSSAAHLDIADLAWRRLKPIRRALVQSLDPVVLPADIGTITSVVIEHGPEGDHAMGLLLVGWMGAQLGWTPIGVELRSGGAVARLRSGEHEVSITLRASRPIDALHIGIHAGGSPEPAIDLLAECEEIRVAYGIGVPGFIVASPRRSRAEMLTAELGNLRADPCLRASLQVLDALSRP